MTIGIAAYGPRAGGSILHALKAVETLGRGALGGFVSLATIDEHGIVNYYTCQKNGAQGLFLDNCIPASVAQAKFAVLMSSGPNRPEPLQTFTPGLSGIGLITGHRMPNTLDENGTMMNERVLELIKDGLAPQHALGAVLEENPNADVGFLMLSIEHGLYAANNDCVTKRLDQGLIIRQDKERKFGTGVIHNAIEPHKAIAHLAVEVAIDYMFPNDLADQKILFCEGTPLKIAESVSVVVDAECVVREIHVTNTNYVSGTAHIGLGFEVPVFKSGHQIGRMKYEPFMEVVDGVLVLIDGYDTLSVSIGH